MKEYCTNLWRQSTFQGILRHLKRSPEISEASKKMFNFPTESAVYKEVHQSLLTEKKNNRFWKKKRSRRHFGGPVYQINLGLFSFKKVLGSFYFYFFEHRFHRICCMYCLLQRTALHEFASLRRKIILFTFCLFLLSVRYAMNWKKLNVPIRYQT